MAWHVLGLQMKETAFRYGVWLQMYLISSCEHPTRGGSPALGLGEGLTTPHCKNHFVMKCSTEPWNCMDSLAVV